MRLIIFGRSAGSIIPLAAMLGLLTIVKPASADLNNYSVLYNETGSDLLQQMRYQDAIPYLRESIRLDATYEPPHRNLSCALLQTGDIAGAVEEATTALAMKPNDGYAFAYLGQAYAAGGHLKEAVQSVEDGILQRPGDPAIVCILGSILVQNRMPKAAIVQFKYAIGLDSACSAAHCGMGDALLHLGRYAAAIRELRRAIVLYHNYPYARLELGLALQETGDAAEANAEWRLAERSTDAASAQLAQSYLQTYPYGGRNVSVKVP